MSTLLHALVPAPLVTATRPIRRLFHPQHRFDRRFGVETVGYVDVKDVDLIDATRPRRADAGDYEPTRPSHFRRIMRWVEHQLGIDPSRFAFVDLGSGKGAALLYAAAMPFARVIGVEHSPTLHAIAVRNLAAFRAAGGARCADVRAVCGDATACELPGGPLVLFFANSFKGGMLDAIVANLATSLQAHPREVVVVYVHTLARHDAWDRAPYLARVRRDRLCSIYHRIV